MYLNCQGDGQHDPDGRQDWQPEENLMQGRDRIIRAWRWWKETDPDDEQQDQRQWQKHADKMPRQLNNMDCGVMMCLAMHRLMLQSRRPRTLEEWGFKGTDGTRGRYRMINELATSKIIERNA